MDRQMTTPDELLEKNRLWASSITDKDPLFFDRLSKQQTPQYLWIGCSDSRVPANQIVDLQPGEIFVHRNIGNLVQPNDINCLSVVQFAVEYLNVKHVIVCGHYGCGGIAAATDNKCEGLVDYWVWNIKLTYKKHQSWLEGLSADRLSEVLCELNVVEQVHALSQTRVIQDWWQNDNTLDLHGWIYSINNGILRDLKINCHSIDDSESKYQSAIEQIRSTA